VAWGELRTVSRFTMCAVYPYSPEVGTALYYS